MVWGWVERRGGGSLGALKDCRRQRGGGSTACSPCCASFPPKFVELVRVQCTVATVHCALLKLHHGVHVLNFRCRAWRSATEVCPDRLLWLESEQLELLQALTSRVCGPPRLYCCLPAVSAQTLALKTVCGGVAIAMAAALAARRAGSWSLLLAASGGLRPERYTLQRSQAETEQCLWALRMNGNQLHSEPAAARAGSQAAPRRAELQTAVCGGKCRPLLPSSGLQILQTILWGKTAVGETAMQTAPSVERSARHQWSAFFADRSPTKWRSASGGNPTSGGLAMVAGGL